MPPRRAARRDPAPWLASLAALVGALASDGIYAVLGGRADLRWWVWCGIYVALLIWCGLRTIAGPWWDWRMYLIIASPCVAFAVMLWTRLTGASS